MNFERLFFYNILTSLQFNTKPLQLHNRNSLHFILLHIAFRKKRAIKHINKYVNIIQCNLNFITIADRLISNGSIIHVAVIAGSNDWHWAVRQCTRSLDAWNKFMIILDDRPTRRSRKDLNIRCFYLKLEAVNLVIYTNFAYILY